jgi:hypothetical protein
MSFLARNLLEAVMTSAFKEFSETYEEFRRQYANHPLNDDVRNTIARGRLPSDEWLKARTKRMKELMAPMWQRPYVRERQN